jgi:uncharacterized protein (TIGR02145 family)
VAGCQTANACNFNPLATNPAACIFATGCDFCSNGSVVDGDTDNDGVCNTNEIVGCTQSSASNFNPAATDNDGSCTYSQCGGISTVSFDGYTYALIGIGNQCWFKENLRSDNYLNGDPIPGNLSDSQWISTTSGAQTVYGEGYSPVYDGSGDEVANLATYGRLYNWYAVKDSRGLCPTGYHVSNDEDWNILESHLGGSSLAGHAMKSAAPGWDGTNSSGFTALPGGYRHDDTGSFSYLGGNGYWWSLSPNGQIAWFRQLKSLVPDFFRLDSDAKRYGRAVRCVQDCQDADGDGICNNEEVVGCQTPGACNYSALATDAGACLIPVGCDTCDQGNLVDNDSDDDGVCDANEVLGCTSSSAFNFDPSATEEDGSCLFGPAQCSGHSTIVFDNYSYQLVGIGTRCWFKENLRSDNYLNGDSITGDLTAQEWVTCNTGAQCAYNSNPQFINAYGRLYNWYAVNDNRGLCPSGWHVPTDAEWTALENLFGGSSLAGASLKATSSNVPPWNGTDDSGFTAVPGGFRFSGSGGFTNLGATGNWWTSTPNGGTEAIDRYMSVDGSGVDRGPYNVRAGFSVRCIMD